MEKATCTGMLPLMLFVPPAAAQERPPEAGTAASRRPGGSYPSRPIRIIIPFTGGSATDILARTIGPKFARNSPGRINFASAGIGSGTHYAGELFKVAAKIDVVHVPYKGTPEARGALVKTEIETRRKVFAAVGARPE